MEVTGIMIVVPGSAVTPSRSPGNCGGITKEVVHKRLIENTAECIRNVSMIKNLLIIKVNQILQFKTCLTM